MSVYVDDLVPCMKNKRWRYNRAAHLVADTLDELHSFAGRIGLKREWFQSGGSIPHYDLTERKRLLAVRYGAVEIDRRQFVALMRKFRETKNETN